MLREFGFHRYGFHVLYGGHNAIPHSDKTKSREVDLLFRPLCTAEQDRVHNEALANAEC